MINSNENTFIFVLSMGRSGSTYILNACKQLPQTFTCYANEWNVVQRYHKLLDSSYSARISDFLGEYENDPKKIDKVTEALAEYDLDARVTLECFIGIVAKVLSEDDRTTFLIKTTDLNNLWLYKKLFPTSKFIINIRNPIDYIHSFHLFWAKIEYQMFPEHWDVPIHVSATQIVENCFQQAWLNAKDERCMVAKLEDFDIGQPDLAIKTFSSLMNFMGVNLNDPDEYQHLLKRGLGLNSSSRIEQEKKRDAYARLGLTRAERIVLERSEVYAGYFYPDLLSTIENEKSANLISRFFKYEAIVARDKRRRFYYLRLIKRVFSLFKGIFLK